MKFDIRFLIGKVQIVHRKIRIRVHDNAFMYRKTGIRVHDADEMYQNDEN